MIVIVISHDNCYTIKRFLKTWGRSLRGQVRLIFYDDLAHRKTLPRAVYIFTDLERLSPVQVELAGEAARQLKATGIQVYNEPDRVLGRYDLLRALHAEGINRFTAYRLADDLLPLRFPVFLRFEREHQGSLSPLLHNRQELDAAVEKTVRSGLQPEDLLIVEFCPVADENGVYRKYATFLIGEQLASRHVVFSRDWVIKGDSIPITTEMRAEKAAFGANPHPHEQELRTIFQRAGINYGRIDYGIRDGAIQVWEINTNPSIVPESAVAPERRDELEVAYRYVAQQICSAFKTLLVNAGKHGLQAGASTPPVRRRMREVPFRVPHDLRQRLGVRPLDRALHPLRRVTRPFNVRRIKRWIKRFLKKQGQPQAH